MTSWDWLLFASFLIYTVWDGARKSRNTRTAEDYFLAGRNVAWWAMGLSIMATQASAITLIGTTGLGMEEGLRFVQFYFALPIAMVILCFTLVPLFHRERVFTAYEYLGLRFDRKTRLLSAAVFLVLRGLSVGVVIYAPSVVLASLLAQQTDLAIAPQITVVIMGLLAVSYTTLGGMHAVIATDVKQMVVIVLGLGVTFATLLSRFPADIGWSEAMSLAEGAGRLETVDFRWDPQERYTIPSSLLGGLFLFLAYFGADQSQVQRYLSGRSLRQKQGALLLNALLKVPFQYCVLLSGVLLFVFYLFHTPPISFVPAEATLVSEGEGVEGLAADYRAACEAAARSGRRLLAEGRSQIPAATRRAGEDYRDALREVTARKQAYLDFREKNNLTVTSDVNFAFPHFILNFMPAGITGLLLAAIFAAALSSIDSELNAMATVAVVDVYQFGLRRELDERSTLKISRAATILLGLCATAFALYAGQLESVIEAVNRVGTYFYGSLLGVFVLAVAVPFANGHGAFVGLLCGILTVWLTSLIQGDDLAFLYLNTIGTLATTGVGSVVSLFTKKETRII